MSLSSATTTQRNDHPISPPRDSREAVWRRAGAGVVEADSCFHPNCRNSFRAVQLIATSFRQNNCRI